MKALFLCLFIVPSIAFAQLKGANKILVPVSDTANLLNRLSAAFYGQGYTLKQKDEAVGFVSTEERNVGRYVTKIRINALIQKDTIIFTGTMYIPGYDTKDNYNTMKNVGQKGSYTKTAWEHLEKIAKAFGTLIYRKD